MSDHLFTVVSMKDLYDKKIEILEAERDKLRGEVERLSTLNGHVADRNLKLETRIKGLRACLEYIELTGGNCGHDGMNKGVPCPCGACISNEATKALAEDGV